MRTTMTTAQRGLLWSLSLLGAGLGCASRGANDGSKAGSDAADTDTPTEGGEGAPTGSLGAPTTVIAALAERPLPTGVVCGDRTARAPATVYEPVDIDYLMRLCEEDPTPDLRALSEVWIGSREELLGLRCLCAADGTLTIDLSSAPGGSDGALVALAGLREVDGLTLQGDVSAVDLRPLRRLSPVRELRLSDLPLLETLDDLPSIEPNGALHLHDLPRLHALGPPGDSPMLSRLTLDALPALALPRLPAMSGPGAEVELRGLPGLRSLRGLEGVVEARSIILDDLPLIASLAPLGSLTAVDQLLLSDLPALTSLRGLDALASAGRIELSRMDGLRRLDGLGGLRALVELVVTDNADLRSFEGLAPGLVIRELWVERDPALTRLGDAGSPAVDHLTLTDLDALVEVDLHACGAVDRHCSVQMTRLPLLEALPRFGEGVLEALDLRELGSLRSLAQRVRVDYRTELRFIALDRLERLDLIAEPTPRGALQVEVYSVELVSLPALRGLGWDRPMATDFMVLRDLPTLTDLEGMGPAPGVLTIEDLPLIESLRGIDLAPAGIRAVRLRRLPSLRSLEGLDRQELTHSLELTDLPALTELDWLTLGTRVASLHLTRTGVEHLNLPDASFRYTLSVYAEDNPALRTADLDALRPLAIIRIVDSPLFEGFSTLPEVEEFYEIELRRLGALSNIEAFRGLRSVHSVYLDELPSLALEDARWICGIARSVCTITP